MDERRQHPRRVVDNEVAGLPSMLNVQVLDITVGGALLQSTRSVAVGTRGVFRLNLGGRTFTADMKVQRVSPASGGALGFLLGAEFVDVSAADQQLIERFINQ